MLPALAAILPTLIAAGVGAGAQGIAAGIEGDRPENRMTPDQWLRYKGIEQAKRAGGIAAAQGAGAARRGALKDLGSKAGYLGVGDLGGAMMPAFRRAFQGEQLRAQQRVGALEGAAMQEKTGLEAASKERRAALAKMTAMASSAAGKMSEKAAEGTDLEGVPFGAIGGGFQGAIGLGGMASDLERRRRRETLGGTSRPLFGGSGYGVYGPSGLYG